MRARLCRPSWFVAAVAALAVSAFGSAARADIAALIVLTPDAVSTNQVSRLRTILTNSDTADAEELRVSHTLPAGLVIAPWPNLSNTCGGAVDLRPGGTTLALVGGVIPGGAADPPGTCTIAVDLV